jgi:DNA-binding NtrC family response regulator
MSVHRSVILVADGENPSGEILASLRKWTRRPVRRCTFDTCREHVVWARPDDVILVASTPGECCAVAALAQEHSLRRSPCSLIIVQADPAGPRKELEHLSSHRSVRISWPEGTAALSQAIQDDRAREGDHEAPLEGLAARVACFTPSLLPQIERLALAAAHDVTVLLTGETGTGKTYLARLLHEFSPRRAHPFLVVPCGSQPPNLFESTFFGHTRGAFTGADQAKKGKFTAVGKGTLLLDEIDTLALEQQASLLRVIETGEFEAVGSQETQRSEARIIAASNWDLEEAVEKGRFRQDLYYRLGVMPFHLPPLRERLADIPPLVRGFAAAFNAKYRKGLFDISPAAMAALQAFPWPGNIRQLEHVVQQSVLMSSGPELALRDLPEAVQRHSGRGDVRPAPAPPAGDPSAAGDSLFRSRAEYERRLIIQTLEEHRQNRSRAAQALGISRVTLHKKIKQYGLQEGHSG